MKLKFDTSCPICRNGAERVKPFSKMDEDDYHVAVQTSSDKTDVCVAIVLGQICHDQLFINQCQKTTGLQAGESRERDQLHNEVMWKEATKVTNIHDSTLN